MAHQSETNIRLQVKNMGETTKQSDTRHGFAPA